VSKLRVLCMALFAVFAFGAITASAAFAEPEWLVEEKALIGQTLAEAVGTILLVRWESEALTAVRGEIECSGISVGQIGPGNAGLIEELYSLASVKIGAPLVQPAAECTVVKDNGLAFCKEGEPALMWPENLPWSGTLELMEVGGVEDVLGKALGPSATEEPAYDLECKSLLGVTASELCETLPGKASALLENNAGAPSSVLSWALPESDEELGICGTGTEHVVEIVSAVSGDTWAVTALLGTRLATAISGG
jgi:hypothetical protein